MTTCSRAPQKRGAPPFKVSSADPQTTTYNGHVLNDRDRENSSTHAWKRQVCDIEASLQSVCKLRHTCASSWLESSSSCTNPSLWQQPDILQRQISIKDYIPMAANIPDIPPTTSSGSQARLCLIYAILRISDGHKSQSGDAYTRH